MRMNDIGKYRNEALDGYTYNDLINYGFDINEIKNMLVCIEGLSEVDEIKENSMN